MLQRPPKADRKRRAASARTRRHRRRLRDGKVNIRIDVDADIVDLLIRTQCLREADAADRAAIGRAIEALLAAASPS
jgi:hypothetical protein